MPPLLTIFTPTYNRARLLPRLYESLCRQTCKDFCWLVVDDGSNDETRALVTSWIEAGDLSIRYEYKENGGMHSAHNVAYRVIDTELNTCIDSDDAMPEDAVEKILRFWKEFGGSHVAGIVGLDIQKNGMVIGSRFPDGMASMTLTDFYHHGGRGDKKLVYRTDLMKSLPEYPEFANERYVGLVYKYMLADLQCPLLLLNEPLVIVEYQPDGSSNTMWLQYGRHPQGFAFLRRETMKYNPYLRERFKAAIHHISSCIYLHRNPFTDSPKPLLTLFALPFGLLLHAIICLQANKLNRITR